MPACLALRILRSNQHSHHRESAEAEAPYDKTEAALRKTKSSKEAKAAYVRLKAQSLGELVDLLVKVGGEIASITQVYDEENDVVLWPMTSPPTIMNSTNKKGLARVSDNALGNYLEDLRELLATSDVLPDGIIRWDIELQVQVLEVKQARRTQRAAASKDET